MFSLLIREITSHAEIAISPPPAASHADFASSPTAAIDADISRHFALCIFSLFTLRYAYYDISIFSPLLMPTFHFFIFSFFR
jgi:hypothetical protein